MAGVKGRSGRKKGEETKVIRVPAKLAKQIEDIKDDPALWPQAMLIKVSSGTSYRDVTRMMTLLEKWSGTGKFKNQMSEPMFDSKGDVVRPLLSVVENDDPWDDERFNDWGDDD